MFLRVGKNDTGYSELLEAGDSRKGVVGWHCALPAENPHPKWQRRTKFFGFGFGFGFDFGLGIAIYCEPIQNSSLVLVLVLWMRDDDVPLAFRNYSFSGVQALLSYLQYLPAPEHRTTKSSLYPLSIPVLSSHQINLISVYR